MIEQVRRAAEGVGVAECSVTRSTLPAIWHDPREGKAPPAALEWPELLVMSDGSVQWKVATTERGPPVQT